MALAALLAVWALAWPVEARAQRVESAADLKGSPARATLTVEMREGSGAWGRRASMEPLDGGSVSLRVKAPPGGEVRWYLIFPDVTRTYENANPPWKPNPYKWIGVAKIDYLRVELTHHRGESEIAPFGDPKRDLWAPVRAWFKAERGRAPSASDYNPRVGTFRFQAVVVGAEGELLARSPGLEEVGDKGISTKVARISVRGQAGYLGYVASFYNVPGVFGSVSHQSNHYIGVDCADMLVAAWGRSTGRTVKNNYNVDMLVTGQPKRAEAELRGGAPAERLAWGVAIEPGDLIAVRYEGASRYQHVGVLAGDTDGDGVLSAGDRVLHAGPHPIKEAPLSEGSFDGRVAIVRLRKL